MALTLTLNTSEKRIQILLSREGTQLHFTDEAAPQCGAELLAPALVKSCQHVGEKVSAITRVACVAGPGSFTGLRLALTTAAGLARAGNVQQAGLNYLQCLAANVKTDEARLTAPLNDGQVLRVLVNARRGWLYWADFESSATPRALTELALISLDNAAEIFATLATPDYILGSGLTHNHAWFQHYYDDTILLGEEFDLPAASALLAMTNVANWAMPDIEPLYLRDCDAVDNLDHIARTQGQNPERAHAELHRLLKAGLVTTDQ